MNELDQEATERVELEEPLFTREQLKQAASIDLSIKPQHIEIYERGIQAQQRAGTVTVGQAKAIGITHKKAAKALERAPDAVLWAQQAPSRGMPTEEMLLDLETAMKLLKNIKRELEQGQQ